LVAISTIVIAFATWKTWREVQSASTQTDKIVTASQKIQTALETSNTQNQNALTQTLAQSKQAMDASNRQSKTALDTTIENSKLDERPWVGLKDFRCDACTSDPGIPTLNLGQGPMTVIETVSINRLYGIMENTGKTPAVKMIVDAIWTNLKASDPIPDYDTLERDNRIRNASQVPPRLPPDMAEEISKEMEIENRLIQSPETVFPPSAIRTLPLVGNIHISRNRIAKIEDRVLLYAVGRITYRSTWSDEEHTTTFCLMNNVGSEFRFCPTGNSMN
jgi:hypothetical protein